MTQNYVYPILVPCYSGKRLKVEEGSLSGITIEGKFHEDSSYTDLEVTGLDLSTYAGFNHQVDIRVNIASGQEGNSFDFAFIIS